MNIRYLSRTLFWVAIGGNLLLACNSSTSSEQDPHLGFVDEPEIVDLPPVQTPIPPGNTDNALQTGYLLDSAVTGVNYTRSGGTAGTTDADGAFDFYFGETVEFFVGNVAIGSLLVAPPLELGPVLPSGIRAANVGNIYTVKATPLNLTPNAVNSDDPRVVNKLIFLQTLDDDGDLENGIYISEAVHLAADNVVIDFSRPTSEFVTGEFASLVANLNAEQIFSAHTPRAIRTEIEALRHFGDLNSRIYGFGPSVTTYTAWWREQNGCAGVGKSVMVIKSASVLFCPNIRGHDGCYEGVVKASGDILLPSMTTNSQCAAYAPGSDLYNLLNCNGAEYQNLSAGLKYVDGQISGNYQASCNDASVNSIQSITASFYKTRTEGIINSGNNHLFSILDHLRNDISEIVSSGSCAIDSDCEVLTLKESVNCSNPEYLVYPVNVDVDSLLFKQHIYSDVAYEIDSSENSGGFRICITTQPPNARCVENVCQSQ